MDDQQHGSLGEATNGKEFLKPASIPGKKIRQKVALGPGCSMMDWVKLCNSGKDLAGTRMLNASLNLSSTEIFHQLKLLYLIHIPIIDILTPFKYTARVRI
tara:strand:+ start:2555 stop:2857 length:303 start_codon:yes stop_codon:yes gene_type:complete